MPPNFLTALRDACDKEELRIAEVQNELAKLQVGRAASLLHLNVAQPGCTYTATACGV